MKDCPYELTTHMGDHMGDSLPTLQVAYPTILHVSQACRFTDQMDIPMGTGWV